MRGREGRQRGDVEICTAFYTQECMVTSERPKMQPDAHEDKLSTSEQFSVNMSFLTPWQSLYNVQVFENAAVLCYFIVLFLQMKFQSLLSFICFYLFLLELNSFLLMPRSISSFSLCDSWTASHNNNPSRVSLMKSNNLERKSIFGLQLV